MTDTKNSVTPTARDATSEGWTDEERAAMKEHAEELKKAKRRGSSTKKADGEADVLAKIAEMPEPDRSMATRIHEIVMESAPDLSPRTWYGMPAYANTDRKVICFFTPASKFKERYASFGFNADAHLDEGTMWPTSWALTKLTADDEAKIGELVKKAVS